MFSFVVNDFGIEYIGKKDSDNLLKYLQEEYAISEDWTGDKYPGLALKWGYVNINISVLMPVYVQTALLKFQSDATPKNQDALHRWNQPTYGANTQYANTGNVDLVDAQSMLYVQLVCGYFLY